MRIVLATRNKGKVEELKRMSAGLGITFLTLDAFPGCPEVIEDGKTFRANALKKARAIALYSGHCALADDSGLEVDALQGRPGVRSARYAGADSTDRENVRKLLRDMRRFESPETRRGRFVCCIAFAFPDGRCRTFSGVSAGTVGKRRRGCGGFGYDPVFFPKGDARTFAEMTASEKDARSHRGKALRKLRHFLETLGEHAAGRQAKQHKIKALQVKRLPDAASRK